MITTLSQRQSVSQYSGGTRFPDVNGKILEETFNTGPGVFSGGGNFTLVPSSFWKALVAGDTTKLVYDESQVVSVGETSHSVLLYARLPKVTIGGDNYREVLDVMIPDGSNPSIFDIEFYTDSADSAGKYTARIDAMMSIDNDSFEVDGSGEKYMLMGYSINYDTGDGVVYWDGNYSTMNIQGGGA